MITILLGTYNIISQICSHIWDIIIGSFVTEISSCKITKDLNQKSYKICQRTIEQMRNKLNIYQTLYYPYQFKSGLKKILGIYLQTITNLTKLYYA